MLSHRTQSLYDFEQQRHLKTSQYVPMSKIVSEHAHKQPRVHNVIAVQSLVEHVNPRLSTYIP